MAQLTIKGVEYNYHFDNACIRDLGRIYKHKTINETLDLINTQVKLVAELQASQEMPFDLLDFLQNLFYVGFKASNQTFDLSERDIYNAIMDEPELLGKGLVMVMESFEAKENQPDTAKKK